MSAKQNKETATSHVKHVCFFGIYNPEYSRNKILLEGFAQHGITVTQCQINPSENGRVAKYFQLVKKYLQLPRHDFDFILVAFPGPTVVWLARILFRSTVVYDAFVSFYDSNVFDRKICTPTSVRGRWNWFLDWQSTKLAHRCLFDTREHIKLFQRLYNVPEEKCIRIFIGADTSLFHRIRNGIVKKSTTLVHFHGSFIPLQGIPFIIDAVRHLREKPDIMFRIVGGSEEDIQIYKNLLSGEGLLERVEFTGKVSSTEIPKYIAEADITLGIFGNTAKAQRVIPNKVFECATMGKPIITANTPAIHEAFKEGKNIVLCRNADGEDLARAVRTLVQDTEFRDRVGEGAYNFVQKEMTPFRVIQPLLKVFEERHAYE